MKKFIFLLLLLGIHLGITAQTEPSKALVLIDIQDFYFDEDKLPLEGNLEAAETASRLLAYFRNHNFMIIHIHHRGGGDIHPLVSPLEGEISIEKTHVNAFRGTSLETLLRERKIEELVLAGMQTHMCLEAATRAADDLGFQCTVIHDACATRDLQFKDRLIPAEHVHLSTLSTLESYALVIDLEEFLTLEKP